MPDTKPTIDAQTVRAILKALESGLRVEILQGKDGEIIVQTVKRKRLKTE